MPVTRKSVFAAIAMKPWRRLFRMIVTICRHLRPLRLAEFRVYQAIEARLSKTEPRAAQGVLKFVPLDKRLIRESLSLHSDYRIIDINDLTDDTKAYLEDHGLSSEYIAANRPGLPVGDACDDLYRWPRERRNSAFQLDALATRSIQAVSPRSGKLIRTDRSILAEKGEAIYYRFTDCGLNFYLAVGREGMGYIKLYFYFPTCQTVVLLGIKDWAWTGRWEVDQLRAYLVANSEAVWRYLTCATTARMCAVVDQPHFAHHLWNTLTGLQEFAASPDADNIDTIVVTAEPMGPIERLFPEFPSDRLERLPDTELVNRTLSDNLFLLRPGGTVVDDRLAKRIHNVAVECSSAELVGAARDFRRSHWPILWATVRAGNRTWVSQAKGIAAIAARLKETYPSLGLVLDGFSRPYGAPMMSEPFERLIQEEEAIAREIQRALHGSIEVRVNVGKPMFESVIYASTIDCYLAHHGSLQNKIAWLANKPGVVHSNKTVLDGINGTMEYYPAFSSREHGVRPKYLRPSFVKDVPGAVGKPNLKWIDPLDNYDFDAHVACDELLWLLREEVTEGK